MTAKVSILDIARLAGVSRTTVSRVLNESLNVDPETRQRVLQVIAEQRYVPSINAQGLKGQNRLLGLVMPTIYWSALLDIVWSVTTMAKEANYGIVLYSCATEAEYQTVLEQIVQTQLVAGVLSAVYTQPVAQLVALHAQGFPVVLIDPVDLTNAVPRVSVNHREGAYIAVRHLIELGHRRLGYIQGPPEFHYAEERYLGYCDALREAGIAIEPDLLSDGETSFTSGHRAAEAFLSQESPPTAIFASNDYAAYGVMEIAAERGVRIPEDLALVGFNDDQIMINDDALQRRHLTLTTIRQPFPEMGRCAVALLLSLIDRRHELANEWDQYRVIQDVDCPQTGGESSPPQIRLPTRLVVRSTCGQIKA